MKYEKLRQFLVQQEADCELSFEQIEQILGFKLPASAYRHQPWWSNSGNGHSHAQAWLEAGRKTHKVRLDDQTVSFRREGALAEAEVKEVRGVREEGVGLMDGPGDIAEQQKPAADPGAKSLFGALKGTVRVPADCDLTDPVADEPAGTSLHG